MYVYTYTHIYIHLNGHIYIYIYKPCLPGFARDKLIRYELFIWRVYCDIKIES